MGCLSNLTRASPTRQSSRSSQVKSLLKLRRMYWKNRESGLRPHIASLITSGGRLLLAMLERCIADAGGTFLFCDTDSAAIVSAQHKQPIPMPNGAKPITALSWAEVQRIVDKFESLNPYDRKLIPGSILKIHKLNWDRDKTAKAVIRLQHCCEEIRALHENRKRY